MTRVPTDVAVAVFVRPDGSFLLSSRPEGKPWPGYWEFPGGKIEPGETVLEAMKRELIEELNVAIAAATPWFTFLMHYTHATVRLHCWRVTAWEGEMRGMEGQQFEWQRLNHLTVSPTLPGCVPIFNALGLPPVYAITNAGQMGVDDYLQQLDMALKRGLKLIQVREKNMSPDVRRDFAQRVVLLARKQAARVLINGDIELALKVKADGIHLTGEQLAQCETRPDFPLVAASVHGRAEIERAAELKFDFVVLGAVKATLTHPGQAPLGWPRFSDMVVNTPLPVYALGGLAMSDMRDAEASGAHGIAMQRGVFKA